MEFSRHVTATPASFVSARGRDTRKKHFCSNVFPYVIKGGNRGIRLYGLHVTAFLHKLYHAISARYLPTVDPTIISSCRGCKTKRRLTIRENPSGRLRNEIMTNLPRMYLCRYVRSLLVDCGIRHPHQVVRITATATLSTGASNAFFSDNARDLYYWSELRTYVSTS